MKNKIEQFRYLSVIAAALNMLYSHDRDLLRRDTKTHEQTISFRIAHYLSCILEDNASGFYVDCEYHRDIYNPDERKCIYGTHVRPDIIYHNRGKVNSFCVEIKRRSMATDYRKIWGYIHEYNYAEGYCIYNIGENYITVSAFTHGSPELGRKFRFRFNSKTRSLEQLKN